MRVGDGAERGHGDPGEDDGAGADTVGQSAADDGRVDDLEAALTHFGREFATAVARSAERAAVMRLTIAEGSHFPVLLERSSPNTSVQRALADRLAALAEQGLLAAGGARIFLRAYWPRGR